MTTPQNDESLTPDYKASIEFLQKWNKGGPWVLVALAPDKKEIEAATFGQRSLKEAEAWLEEQGTKLKRNIYFGTNPCVRPMKKKPERVDIAALAWIHVDLDPRAGEDHAAERARIFEKLRNLPDGIPPPTCIIDSGGGYQAFWRLRDPRLLTGSADDYEDAKLYNKQLELRLGGDSCHNIDRIMRLPGTLNRPDAKKRKKGRVLALASVVEFNDSQHDLAGFEKASAVATPSKGAPVVVSIDTANVKRFASVDDIPELRDARHEQCRVVIAQGLDPDNPGKHPSKSEWQHFVCCEMVRAGCSDETIFAVITDPDFGVSKTVLEKGRGAERYAMRQIERAREEAIDPLLRELNDKHAVIGSIGGKCRITSWERRALGRDALGREVLHLQTQADFMLRYKNRSVDWLTDDGKAASKPAALWWLEHRQRREFEGIVFDPSVEGDLDGHLNLWRGFSIAAAQGEYPLLRELVDDVLAAGDPTVAEYLWRWTAWLVQNPHKQAEVAIVLRGLPGTGKGTWVRALGRLLGQHFAHVSSSKDVAGKFNAHMRDCVLLFADEAFLGGGGQDAIGTLKRIITEPTLFIEGKGENAVQWPNRLHVVMASNEDWVVPAGPDERRFVVTDVSPARKEDHAWFERLDAELEGGGLAAWLHDMLSMDLGDWHPRRGRPMTAALVDQKVRSLAGLDAAWFECLQSGELPMGKPEGECVWIASSEFLDGLNLSCRPRAPFSANQLRALLAEPQKNHRGRGMGFEARREKPGEGPRGYVVPPLAEARRRWNERRFPYQWDDAEGWIVRGFDANAYSKFA